MDPLILIVEDSEDNRQLIRWMLEDANLNYIEATSGEEGVEQARTHDNITLILMDISLPGISGKVATQQIRQLEVHENTPIIALTAHTDLVEHEAILASGINEVQTKPIDEDVLIETIKKHLQHA